MRMIITFCRSCHGPIYEDEGRPIAGYCEKCYRFKSKGQVSFRSHAQLIVYDSNRGMT